MPGKKKNLLIWYHDNKVHDGNDFPYPAAKEHMFALFHRLETISTKGIMHAGINKEQKE